MKPVRTLHVDIEGGWGGSSRSLFELLRRIDSSRIAPLVAHRQEGPVQARYAAIGIPTVHVPEIGSFVPRRRNSARILVASLPRLRRLRCAVRRLATLAREHRAECIHLNYEGLFLLAGRLKRATGLPIVCHNRAHLPENGWSRWLVGRMARDCDYLFYISPQEESRVWALAGKALPPGEVLWNIAPKIPLRQPLCDPPEAVYLGKIDPSKGVDRMIEIAAALETLRAPPLRLAVYGEARANSGYLERLRDRIAAEGLGHRIAFRGHTADPEAVLSRALALIRPSRENDPWGRDVIEATAFGVPVLATGSYDGVVEPGVTGYLFDPFDAEEMASTLKRLANDGPLWKKLSTAGRAKGRKMFSGERQASAAADVFERLTKGERA